MALPSSVILVCAGADIGRAAGHGHPLLDLCFGVTARGALGRLQWSAVEADNYIGIRDCPAGLADINAAAFAADLVYEIKKLNARGVFADFENSSDASRALCAALDDALWNEGLPLFVPAVRGDDTQHAILTVETAVSGGSLRGMIEELQKKYGADRIAALLRPVSADFSLPSASPDGMSLAPDERAALRERTQAQVFFSKELCAKYFTYMDADSHGHFVLFDDETTLEEKVGQLTGLGVPYLFALYPDVRSML